MKKKSIVSLIASTLLANFALAGEQSITLVKDWNLLGTNLANSSITSNSDVEATWTYKNGEWSNGVTTLNAGDGFWAKAKNATSLTLTGDDATTNLVFEKAGWHLVSPIKEAISVSSFSDTSKFSAFWVYQDNTWKDRSDATVTVKIGEGFWVNTGSDNVDLDSILNATISGTVDLAGLYSASESTTKARETVNPITGEVIPDEAEVQVYDVNDTDYQEPLLNDTVTVNPLTGEFIVTDSEFKDEDNAKKGNYIIRVIAKKDGNSLEMSALKTKNSKSLEVNPIATAIKAQLLDLLKSYGYDKGEIPEDILTLVDTFSKTLGTKLKDDVKNKKTTLRQADFTTTQTKDDLKKPEDATYVKEVQEKEDKLKSQVNSTSASSDISSLKGEMSFVKKQNQDLSKIDTDESSTNLDIAILKYDIVSSLARMDFAIHDGKGKIIAFLPVDSEEFDKLPGVEYSEKVMIDGEEEVVGDDPALRLIDLEKDLRNARGNEDWSFRLVEALLESPIIPQNAVKSLVKNEFTESKLSDFRDVLAGLKDADGAELFDATLFTKLNGIVLEDDAEESVKSIMEPYKKEIILEELQHLQNDLLFEAIENDDIEDFVDTFSADTKEDFFHGFADSYEFNEIITHTGVPLIEAIPPKANNEAVVAFEDGYEITQDSLIYPKTGIALMNLFSNLGDTDLKLEQKKISDIVGDDVPELDSVKDNMIWWVVSSEDAELRAEVETTGANLDNTKNELATNKNNILTAISSLTKEEIKAEPKLQNVLSNAKQYAKEFKTKVNEREDSFFEDNFESEEQITSEIEFNVVNEENSAVENIAQIVFIPHLENIETDEIVPLTDKLITLSPVDVDNARFKGEVELYSEKVAVDENGEKAEDGKYRYLIDYNVKIRFSDGEEFAVEHPIPLFLQPKNEFDLFIDSLDLGYNGEGFEKPVDDFNDEFLSSENPTLIYPIFRDKEILKFNNFNLEALGNTEFVVIADSIETQSAFWEEELFEKPLEGFVTSIGVDEDTEGSLIYVKTTDDKDKVKDLLLTIAHVDMEEGVEVVLEPFPMTFKEEKAPICKTQDGEEIELPKNENGSYPYPEDENFPADCKGDFADFDGGFMEGVKFDDHKEGMEGMNPNGEKPTDGEMDNKEPIDGQAPMCKDENGNEIAVPMKDNGEYAMPEDAEFPAECKISMDNKPEDTNLDNEKPVENMNPDGEKPAEELKI